MTRRTAARPSSGAAGVARLAAAAALALATVPAGGQERPEEGTVFTGETHVLAVEVPVQVLVRGEPVQGLTAESFRLYDGDELLPLTGFEVVDLSVTSPGSAAGASGGEPVRGPRFGVAPAGGRHFLLLFDLSGTQAGRVSRGLHGARSLVRHMLHPSDLVGVAFYSHRQGLSLALHFTPDRGQVERVLDAFELLLEGKRKLSDELLAEIEAGRRKPDPLGLTVGGFGVALVEVGQAAGYQTSEFAEALIVAGGMGGKWGGFLMDNLLSHSASFMEQVYVEQRAAQLGSLSDSVKALVQGLRSVEGSKHVVLFSQGYSSRLSEVAPGSVDVGSGGGSWLLSVMDEMIEELRRSGWVLHGADLGGIASPFEYRQAAARKATLFYMAHETGGMLIENTNDMAVGLEDVVERTSLTYVLTFQVADVPADGAFHPIRVELVEGPRNARLVHRTGYHAPRPPGEREPFELRAEAAARILAGGETGGLAASVRATALAYSGESARVPVLVEVAGTKPLGGDLGGDRPTELYAYAFDESGAVADFFAHSFTLDVAEGGPGRPARGVKLAGELELPPGRYVIRALVRGARTGQEAVRTVALEVPALDGSPGLLPPLFVQGALDRWVVAAVGDGEGGDTYPFVVEGNRIVPAAVPVLAPGQPARLLLPGVGLSEEGVKLETRILTEAGDPVRSGRLRILGQRAPEAGQPDLLVAILDPEALDPGSYRLEVSLAGTGHRVTAPFRVGG